MRIGLGAPVAGAWATADNLTELGSGAERLGYDSLWTFQRLLVPDGTPMDPVYQSVLDPMVALGYLAAVTSRIRLAVAVINLPFVTPLYLAKQAATVDVVSGGRLDLGLGIGWLPEEFTASGATTARRGARTEEYLTVLRRLWEGHNDAFHGEFYDLPAGRQAPAPVQRPGPPILLGGMSAPAMDRAARVADGWVTSSRTDLRGMEEAAALIQDKAAAAGRGPLRIICRGVVRAGGVEVDPKTGERLLLSGDFDQIRADTAWLGEHGVTELFYDLNWDPAVGSPDIDPKAAAERAVEIMEGLAP
jgi:probable F420-dependent oxidoreductase